jgi:hypothetical protein
MFRPEEIAAVIVDAVGKGISPGHDRTMGWEGQRNLGIGVLEKDAAAGEGIDVRRPPAGIAITAHAVRPGRIQGDEKNIQRPMLIDRGSAGSGPQEKDAGSGGEHPGGDNSPENRAAPPGAGRVVR